MNKLLKLEALRGFAALYVVLHHTITAKFVVAGIDMSILFRFGQEAVILFFILSGFVIELSFQKGKDKSFTLYFLKRFLRIYIPLIMVFAFNYILLLIQKGVVLIDVYNLLGNLLMLQDVNSLKLNVICSPFLGNTPLWSLSYEWWFYMLFFFLISTIKKNISLWVYGIGILCAISYLIYPFFVNRLLMYLTIWWLGVDLAKIYMSDKPIDFKSMKTGLIAVSICTIILAFNFYINRQEWSAKLNVPISIGVSPMLEFRHFAFALASVSIALIWKKLKWIGFNYTFGPFEVFAKISFGVYISHWFLISHAHYLDFIPSLFLRYFLYVVICILFAYFTERIVYVKVNKAFMDKFYFKDNKVKKF